MREVDHQQHAVDQRVAEGDEGVDAALGDAKDQQVAPLVRAELTGGEGGPSADHDPHGHANAQQDEDDVDN